MIKNQSDNIIDLPDKEIINIEGNNFCDKNQSEDITDLPDKEIINVTRNSFCGKNQKLCRIRTNDIQMPHNNLAHILS